MKTASELALEYWDKPPVERINTTLQDYVYDYMVAQMEDCKNKIDELGNHVSINYDCEREDDQHSYWSGYNQAMREINEILNGETRTDSRT